MTTLLFHISRCLGSTQHLKSKFGSGYSLEIKLTQGNDESLSKLEDFVKEVFPGAILSETFGGKSTYKVPKETVSRLSSIFQKLEEGKLQGHIKYNQSFTKTQRGGGESEETFTLVCVYEGTCMTDSNEPET